MMNLLAAVWPSFLSIKWASAKEVAEAYPHHHDVELIILSFLVSVFGSYVSLQFVGKGLSEKSRAARLLWLILGSIIAGGCAIWAMHFVGMLAFNIGIEIHYDLTLTMFSLFLAIAVTGLGLLIMGLTQPSWAKLILTGTIMGIGIASMHYTGMAAMLMEANLFYTPFLFSLSILIAILASIAALWLFMHAHGIYKYLSALVMGIAICGMHYTGMMAAVFTPVVNQENILESSVIQRADFILYIFAAVILTLAIILFFSIEHVEETEEE